jgi:4-hydroxybenzoate polyprenyltransferase
MKTVNQFNLGIKLYNWLKLARISALPTAISNVLAGFLLSHQNWQPVFDLTLLLAASTCIYTAGMISNDVVDFERDSKSRPNRPLPSGAISIRSATIAFLLLMMIGIGIGICLGKRPTMVVSILVICVLLYNSVLKPTIAGPVLMGACRFLNVLLGASTFQFPESSVLGWSPVVIWAAASVGIYIVGVTLLAKKETETNYRVRLLFAGAVMAIGLVGYASIAYAARWSSWTGVQVQGRAIVLHSLLVGLITLPIARRVVLAVIDPRPKLIQDAVGTALRSLIVLDAAVCYWASGQHVLIAAAVLALMVPSVLLSKTIPPT